MLYFSYHLIKLQTDTLQLEFCSAIQEFSSSLLVLRKLKHQRIMASSSSSNSGNAVKLDKSNIEYGNGEILGQGSFGVVLKGVYQGKPVAIKVPTGPLTTTDDPLKELNTMAALRHKNILGLIGVVEDRGKFHLVFDYMEQGSLWHVVTKSPISSEVSINLMHDIACGMCYLHEMDFVHRDLAARNVLVDSRNRAKVADFGLSRLIDTDNSYYYEVKQGRPLPIRWIPKESLPHGEKHGKFSFASDVWSFGVTVWEILTKGSTPYGSITNTQASEKIEGGGNPLMYQRPFGCEPEIIKLLGRIFQVDPKRRPKFDTIKVDISNIRSKPTANITNSFEKVTIGDEKPIQPKVGLAPPPLKGTRMQSTEQAAMLRTFKDAKILHTEKVERIMEQVIRSNYTNSNPFADKPQSIGYGVNISAPHMHVRMLELVAEKLPIGGSALDIGSGSGYITACMGLMVGTTGKVVGIDHIPELVQNSIISIRKDNPQLLSSGIVTISIGDGRLGWPAGGPYDVIHIGAAIETVPKEILLQLKTGGRFVAPVGPPGGGQKLQVTDALGGGRFETKSVLNVIFAPLTSKEAQLRK